MLHILNKYFHKFGVQWDVGLTQKYGDATEMAREAATSGNFDLVVGYGGDGTQHEIANGVMGTDVIMGVLPGGTGNGFGTELGIPHDLDAAVRVLCTSHNVRHVDIAQYNEEFYFIQRLFTGIEPEEQTSREDKDKYGTFAYLMRDINRYKAGEMQDIPYRLTIDGEKIEMHGYKLYVVAGVQLNRLLTGAVREVKEKRGIEVISPDDSYRKFFKALKSNGIIALLLDGDVYTSSVRLKFFGRETDLPRGPVSLSRKSGAPIVGGYCRRLKNGRFHIFCEKILDGKELEEISNEEAKKKVYNHMENYIKMNLDEWCIFRNIWG